MFQYTISTLHWYYLLHADKKIAYTPIAFSERVILGFNVPGHFLGHVLLPHFVCACNCLGYTRSYAQILQHTHMQNAVKGHVEPKKLLSCRRQSNYSLGHPHNRILTHGGRFQSNLIRWANRGVSNTEKRCVWLL